MTRRPESSHDPLVCRPSHRSDLVAAVAVSGDMPSRQLEEYALRLEERIMTLPGVARVAIHGMSQRQWQVEVPLEVSKALRDDALTVKEQLESLLEAERRRFDGGVSLTLTQDATSIVRDRLQMLVGNGLMGLVLVVLVMSLFFRPRLAIWAVLGLPAAFMGPSSSWP
ncbi:efflux RND transporter permease subunit [Halomonas sp. HK25]|uniref:efflux RND transporter permease subunit n=1 Tax=Halomonas sp. HK25 TaxID=3394321 RepID=UPI0039FC44E2